MTNKIYYLLFAVVVILVFMCYKKCKYNSDDECMDEYDEKENFRVSKAPKMIPTITTTKTTYDTKDTRSQPIQNIKPVAQPKGVISKNLPFRIY